MPQWNNKALTIYHGTDDGSLSAYGTLSLYTPVVGFTISIPACRPNTDFGQGFYFTSYLHQARQWANNRVRLRLAMGLSMRAVVLAFAIDRDVLAAADALAFVLATNDYWDLVADCRVGFPPHGRPGSKAEYEVVYGPVSLWQQQLVIHDCDQISVHTQAFANGIPVPIVYDIATNPNGMF